MTTIEDWKNEARKIAGGGLLPMEESIIETLFEKFRGEAGAGAGPRGQPDAGEATSVDGRPRGMESENNSAETNPPAAAPSKIDCLYTVDPVCPHCGKAQRDALEMFQDGNGDGDSTVTECQRCEKPFNVLLHVATHYSTRPTEGSPDA